MRVIIPTWRVGTRIWEKCASNFRLRAWLSSTGSDFIMPISIYRPKSQAAATSATWSCQAGGYGVEHEPEVSSHHLVNLLCDLGWTPHPLWSLSPHVWNEGLVWLISRSFSEPFKKINDRKGLWLVRNHLPQAKTRPSPTFPAGMKQ